MKQVLFFFFSQSSNTVSLQADYKMIFLLFFFNFKEEYIVNATGYSVRIALQHCVCTMNRTNFPDDYTLKLEVFL